MAVHDIWVGQQWYIIAVEEEFFFRSRARWEYTVATPGTNVGQDQENLPHPCVVTKHREPVPSVPDINQSCKSDCVLRARGVNLNKWPLSWSPCFAFFAPLDYHDNIKLGKMPFLGLSRSK